jgi:hypothetical protein
LELTHLAFMPEGSHACAPSGVFRFLVSVFGRGWPGDCASAALVLQAIAFAGDLHDGGVMQDLVEHRGGQHRIAGEGIVSLRSRSCKSRTTRMPISPRA